MKKNRICLFIIFILAVSCTKSRFATTTRHYHNGKVAYTKHYSIEHMKEELIHFLNFVNNFLSFLYYLCTIHRIKQYNFNP